MAKKPEPPVVNTDELLVSGEAFEHLLSAVNVDKQIKHLKEEILQTKSPSKKDTLVKKIKYLAGLKKSELKPQEAYILRNVPVAPPIVRPPISTGGNKIEYPDVNDLYKDHMTVNMGLAKVNKFLPADQLVNERKGFYDGLKAVIGLGEAVEGSSRGKKLKGYLKQVGGETGPKTGLFHNKLLSKKQDFSGRATIYAEPNLSFNEAAVPKDMLWTMYEFHIIRDLVKNGFDYVSAKKAVESRNQTATTAFNKMIKQVPILMNRAPTLMRSNITAFFPVPIEGKTLGFNPLMLPMMAGDYDGDALTVHVPLTPLAVEEAKKRLLPSQHVYDLRKGIGVSMVAPGHEAIIGAMHLTEPDTTQKPVSFKTEQDALAALKAGTIKENTPLIIG